MSKLVAIRIISSKGTNQAGTVEMGAGTKGAPLRIKAGEGAIELQDVANKNLGPQAVRVKRVGRDLLLAFEGGDIAKPDLVLEDFYAQAGSCRLIGRNADGGTSEYAPASGNANDRIDKLAVDAVGAQVLGKEFCSIVPAMLGGTGGTAPAAATASEVNPLVWAAVGVGVLGLAAAGGGGGGGGGTPGPVTIAPPPSTLSDSSDSGTKGDNRTNDNTPTIGGTGVAGQTIVITGPGGISVSTQVGTNGTWTATLPTLPEGATTLSIVARDSAGNTSTPTALTITVDTVAPSATQGSTTAAENTASIPVDLIAADAGTGLQSLSVTALPTAAQGVLYLANGTTPVTVGQALTAAQAAALVFVPTANFNGAVTISFTGTDAVGNVSAVATETITITPVNSAPSIARSATDALTILEGQTIDLNGRGYAVQDADAGTGQMRLTITAADGGDTFNVVTGSSGVTLVSGNGTSTVVLEGTLAQLNALLASNGSAGRITLGDEVPLGSDGGGNVNVSMSIDDLGNTGGAALTSTTAVSVATTAVDEVYVGTGANNVRNGGAGNDILYGAAGDDTLEGGAGNDILVGGVGYIRNSSFEHWTSLADAFGGNYPNWFAISQLRDWTILTPTVELNSYNTNDTVDNPQSIRSTANSQDGRYAIDVHGAGISQTVATQGGAQYQLTFELTDQSTDSAQGDVHVTIDGVLVAVITSGGVMTLTGSAVNGSVTNVVNAQGPGPLHGNYVNDRQYQFTFTADGDGASTILFSSPTLIISNGRALDDVRLTPLSGDGNDVLIGGAGGDQLWGMQGSNVLTGGAGVDEFHVSRVASGTDTITDFEVGIDKLVINDLFDLTATNTQHAGTVPNANQLLGFDDLISVGGTDQTITWDDVTKTLTFGWGGSVTFQGMTASYATAADFLTANAILRMESFGSGA